MNIITEFTTICAGLERPVQFILADLTKAAKITDVLKQANFPCLVMIPVPVKDVQDKSGITKTRMVFEGFMLDKLADQKTIDFAHAEVEEKAIVPMRKLARQFVKDLNGKDFMFEKQSIREVDYQPTYSSMDAHLHGVEFSFTFDYLEGLKVC
jgi:hypothetical protein